MKGDSPEQILPILKLSIDDCAAIGHQLPQNIHLGCDAKRSRREFCSLCPVWHGRSWLHGKLSILAVVLSSCMVQKPSQKSLSC